MGHNLHRATQGCAGQNPEGTRCCCGPSQICREWRRLEGNSGFPRHPPEHGVSSAPGDCSEPPAVKSALPGCLLGNFAWKSFWLHCQNCELRCEELKESITCCSPSLNPSLILCAMQAQLRNLSPGVWCCSVTPIPKYLSAKQTTAKD